MAPELIVEVDYEPEKVDVFAMGVVLFILVTGMPPWKVVTE